ncbi:hypothetical protein [Rhodocyclus tenuis]|uniref:EF-hand domain-containing protein n=1 Tax=Rhodocyclus tenuis TaxID=1066 RepID=A0A840GAT0_RHOTE|nr:hypothetical protein [Rhodocyclus tenuis]MBB4248975.1 hypothetical protein [Rhodocyclus tenuis]
MMVRWQREYGQFVTSGAQLVILVFGIEIESREGWLICLALLALLSLFAWLSAVRRRRTITDTPTSRIASAAQGYVELGGRGKALDGTPLFSPLTGFPCLWYRFQIETKDHDGKWRTVERGESKSSFLLDDDSGECVIDPERAEIMSRHKEVRTIGSRRHSEWTLQIGDPIYAIGEFRTIGGAALELDAANDTRALLADWKEDQKTLVSRFDLDGDGELSMQEWKLARQAARREVSRRQVELRAAADIHLLGRPADGKLHLVANLDPKGIARRYLYWAIFHLLVFFAALAALPWVWQREF